MESAAPVAGSFQAFSVGESYACALQTHGAAECWSHSYDYLSRAQDNPPVKPPADTSFTSISVGKWHACGVRTDNAVKCWGDNYVYEEYCSPGALGLPVCGLTRRGDYAGQAVPPPGEFRAVSAGYAHTCGIRLVLQSRLPLVG